MIAIVGDVILDVNCICDRAPARCAPEADTVKVYSVDRTEYILGGAANVAQNLHSLGMHVKLFSVLGTTTDANNAMAEAAANKIRTLLFQRKIQNNLLRDITRISTQKYRRFLGNSLVDRVDYETTHDISIQYVVELYHAIITEPGLKYIVFSDYAKGVLTCELCKRLITFAAAHRIFTFVDPKSAVGYREKYGGCFCFKPNLYEGISMTGLTDKSSITRALLENLQCRHVVLTAAEQGMVVGNEDSTITSICGDIEDMIAVDVTGAGDIAFAVLIHVFILRGDMKLAAKVADTVARKSVQQIGNVVATKKMVHASINVLSSFVDNNNDWQKIRELRNVNIVFTNGCFDILHTGHVQLLNYCKNSISANAVVVVGVNADASVRAMKGAMRPIHCLEDRMRMLRELKSVDFVLPFDEMTPLEIIKKLRPDVLVKGGDYKLEEVVGREFAGQTQLFEFVPGKSTSSIVSKMARIEEA